MPKRFAKFAITGSDGRLFQADAVVDGECVLVSSRSILRPAYLRDFWADKPEGVNHYHANGLIAAPFRNAS